MLNKEYPPLPPQKSVLVAYLLWFFGGIFGLHHLYLHRDRHAFMYWCTFGGYFGFLWIAEIFRIPKFVKDINEDPVFIERFINKMKKFPKPPYSTTRFAGAVLLGYVFGQVSQMAIPEHEFGGITWTSLHWLIPFAMSLGVWTVGNIGREKGIIWHCLIGAYMAYPVRYFIYDETYSLLITASVSAFFFDTFSKQWRREPPKRHGSVYRTIRFTTALTVYFSLWGSFMYFNGTISDDDGGEIPVHEAIRNILQSDLWGDLKQSLYDTYHYGQNKGWYETFKEVLQELDLDGEKNAFKALGLSATASQAEITSAYRRLSKEYHPDKVKNEEEKLVAHQKFMEVQQAYGVLSKIKANRRRRNKKFNDDL